MWSNVIRYKDSYFSMVITSNPVIFEFGFFETISNSRFFIRFVFHKKPNQRLYCTLSVIKRLSRVIILPENVLFIIHPSKSTHLSEYSIQRNTVVTVSPGKYTTLSRTVARNSLIVSICAVVTASNSRFFVCRFFINSASLARYLSNSDNFSSKTPTLAAFKLSFVLYVSTSCNNVSVFPRYLFRSSVNFSIFVRCTHIVATAATTIAIAAQIKYFFIQFSLLLQNVPLQSFLFRRRSS